jgi:hypothetical protein
MDGMVVDCRRQWTSQINLKGWRVFDGKTVAGDTDAEEINPIRAFNKSPAWTIETATKKKKTPLMKGQPPRLSMQRCQCQQDNLSISRVKLVSLFLDVRSSSVPG